MIHHISEPTRIVAPGIGEKRIEEFIGHVRTGTGRMSVAHMVAPAHWTEPFQTPAFDEATLVVRGCLRVEYPEGTTDVHAGEVIYVAAGTRIRYSTPGPEETEYWAICAPAFHPDTVHRDSA